MNKFYSLMILTLIFLGTKLLAGGECTVPTNEYPLVCEVKNVKSTMLTPILSKSITERVVVEVNHCVYFNGEKVVAASLKELDISGMKLSAGEQAVSLAANAFFNGRVIRVSPKHCYVNDSRIQVEKIALGEEARKLKSSSRLPDNSVVCNVKDIQVDNYETVEKEPGDVKVELSNCWGSKNAKIFNKLYFKPEVNDKTVSLTMRLIDAAFLKGESIAVEKSLMLFSETYMGDGLLADTISLHREYKDSWHKK